MRVVCDPKKKELGNLQFIMVQKACLSGHQTLSIHPPHVIHFSLRNCMEASIVFWSIKEKDHTTSLYQNRVMGKQGPI